MMYHLEDSILKKMVKQDIQCMSNVRGNKVRVQKHLPFSFYFSGSEGNHSIRVKPMFNPSKLRDNLVGTLKLCDDWEYIPGPNDHAVSQKDIDKMKRFFRKYLVLFAATWDRQIDDGDVYDYLVGDITLPELIECFDFYPEYQEDLDEITTISELEDFCKQNNIVNMYGND